MQIFCRISLLNRQLLSRQFSVNSVYINLSTIFVYINWQFIYRKILMRRTNITATNLCLLALFLLSATSQNIQTIARVPLTLIKAEPTPIVSQTVLDSASKLPSVVLPSVLETQEQAIPSFTQKNSVNDEGTKKCENQLCSYHWVFAMDESGSMNGNKWSNLKGLLEDIAAHLDSLGNQKMTVFTFDSRATLPPQQYIEFSQPSKWQESKANLPANSGGGTEFGQPLIRAIQFILLHKNINTCFVLLTDGQASFPQIEIKLFVETQAYVRNSGYQFCAICYFIKASASSEPPKAFTDLCFQIGGNSIQAGATANPASYESSPQNSASFGSQSSGGVQISSPPPVITADANAYRTVFSQDFAKQSTQQLSATQAASTNI